MIDKMKEEGHRDREIDNETPMAQQEMRGPGRRRVQPEQVEGETRSLLAQREMIELHRHPSLSISRSIMVSMPNEGMSPRFCVSLMANLHKKR